MEGEKEKQKEVGRKKGFNREMERSINGWGGGREGEKDRECKSGRMILNTRELTEQIHLPTLSFSVYLSLFPPILPFSSALLSLSLSHLFPLSPPTPLISFKSSYIPRSVHLLPLSSSSTSPSLPTLAKKSG